MYAAAIVALLAGVCVAGGCAKLGPSPPSGAGVGVVADTVATVDASEQPTQTDAATSVPGLPPLPAPLWGVTVDSIDDVPAIVGSLKHLGLAHKPTARIVFDRDQPPAYYAAALTAIHPHSWVMGELLDSQFVGEVTVSAYIARTNAYLAAFPDTVDLWEIGNEINGEWLITKGGSAADVVAKMTGAYAAVHAAGKRTALTLYLNPECWSDPKHEMFQWVSAHVPPTMRGGLDYVLVSYYEDDCNGLQPDWPAVFAKLRAMFPTAALGVGECGTNKAGLKAAYIQRYYGMKVDVPGYVGGYFWWYFYQDMVPDSKALFGKLFAAMGGKP